MCTHFVRLFQIAANLGCLVSQVFMQGRWQVRFRRMFGPPEQASWLALQEEISVS
jgi:hypothetical protein